jgi:hypothetical protein
VLARPALFPYVDGRSWRYPPVKRWLILVAAVVLAGFSLGCGDNAKDKGKYQGLDKPLPAKPAG